MLKTGFDEESKPSNQGDQIGRIFAHWAIVSFGQFFRKVEKKQP
jgi:hypothetical protein